MNSNKEVFLNLLQVETETAGQTSVWTLGVHNRSQPPYSQPHEALGRHAPEPYPSHWARGHKATEPA